MFSAYESATLKQGTLMMSIEEEEEFKISGQANDTDTEILNCRKLYDILLNKSPPTCCLCLNNITEESPVQLQDEIYLKSEDSILMGEMIDVLLHHEDFISTMVCDSCFKSTIQAYEFIQMCTKTAQKLNKIVDSIANCLTHQDKRQMMKTRPARRVFIATDTNSLQSKLYYDKRHYLLLNKLYSSSYCALKRFKSICCPESLPKFICNNCGLTCRTKNGLRNHLKKEYCNNSLTKTNGRVLCNNCGLLIDRRNIRKHAQACFIRSDPTTYNKKIYPKVENMCNICGMIVTNIKGHLRSHDPKPIKPTKPSPKCEQCGHKFKNMIIYERHIKNKICTQYNVSFQDTIYKCNMCKAQYSSSSALQFHMKIHSNNKEDYFECSECQKRFPSRIFLNQHIVSHTQEKRFECTMCDGKFVTKPSLIYHLRTHTGEKPIKCKLCEQTFLNTSRRADHMRVIHLPPQLQCLHCGKMFKRHQALNRHTQRHLNPKSSLYVGQILRNNASDQFVFDKRVKSKCKRKIQRSSSSSSKSSSEHLTI